jgi:hypothetical protein
MSDKCVEASEQETVIHKLREYNSWRRGDEELPQPDPFEIGGYIDDICEIAERLKRERDEALHKLEICMAANRDVARIARERDDWAEKWAELNRSAVKDVVRLERERDEARETLMRIHGATCTLHTDSERSKIRCPICLERERNEAMALASWVGNRTIATPCRDSCRDHEIEGWKNKWECAVEMAARAENERDEVREKIKELIYIAERAIALAEIDFENDKFGVVSELRAGVEQIKEGWK